MSNLGLYQWMVVAAKKCGGPTRFLAAVGGTGYVVIRAAEAGGKKLYHHVKDKQNSSKEKKISPIMTVSVYAVSDEGIEFKIGDQFRILASVDDGVLIDKLGDPNSPYVISNDFLNRILQK